MKIIHHISMHGSEVEAFRSCGVEPKAFNGGGLVNIATLDIAEDDPRWGQISRLVKKFNAGHMAFTKFSERELRNAKALVVQPGWHWSYPQPEDDYLSITYDLTEYCKSCGIGLKQIRPFRMKSEPAWRSRSILQLNWVFDEYFVKPEQWDRVFRPLGIGCRPVLLDKTGEHLQSVVQLDIDATTGLKLENQAFVQCRVCNRRKYPPGIPGFYPAPISDQLLLAKSTQYVGSAASAYRKVLAGNALYTKIKEANLKGVEFQACI